MVDSTNYGWPLPDPQGIQQTEIGRIADALGLADAKAKALADLIAALTFAAIGGIIANSQLPGRLGASALTVDDWNTAVDSGLYRANGQTAAHAPPVEIVGTGAWCYGRVDNYGTGYCMQTAWPASTTPTSDNTKMARRFCHAGVWDNWFRVRSSDLEIGAMIDSRVSTAIDNLMNGAPGTLDTLNELAAAIGDDPNFAATISAQIGSKLPAASYTAADVLAKLLAVDGPSSGLSVTQASNADKLASRNGSEYAVKANSERVSGAWTFQGAGAQSLTAQAGEQSADGGWQPMQVWKNRDGTTVARLDYRDDIKGYVQLLVFDDAGNNPVYLQIQQNGTFSWNGAEVWHAGNLDTDAKINAAVNALINGSPGALDTLNELAAAMGDDPNFAATITNQLAGKLGVSGTAADSAKLGGAAKSTAPDGGTIVQRDGSGDVQARLFRTEYPDDGASAVTSLLGRVNATTNDYARPITLGRVADLLAPQLTYQGGGANDTVFPVGHTVLVHDSPSYNRNAMIPVCLAAGVSSHYAASGGTALAGIWRQRGELIINSNYYLLAERVQ